MSKASGEVQEPASGSTEAARPALQRPGVGIHEPTNREDVQGPKLHEAEAIPNISDPQPSTHRERAEHSPRRSRTLIKRRQTVLPRPPGYPERQQAEDRSEELEEIPEQERQQRAIRQEVPGGRTPEPRWQQGSLFQVSHQLCSGRPGHQQRRGKQRARQL